MIYLENFKLPNFNEETECLSGLRRTFYDTNYPFELFPNIEFNHLTIFYGDNGSGKSTL